jgi:hypothetical protein
MTSLNIVDIKGLKIKGPIVNAKSEEALEESAESLNLAKKMASLAKRVKSGRKLKKPNKP